jgi:hypothetical protein
VGCDVSKKSIRHPHEAAPDKKLSFDGADIADDSSLLQLAAAGGTETLEGKFRLLKSLLTEVHISRLLASQQIKNLAYDFLQDFNQRFDDSPLKDDVTKMPSDKKQFLDSVSTYFYSICPEDSVICEKLRLFDHSSESSTFYYNLAVWAQMRGHENWVPHLLMAFNMGGIDDPQKASQMYIKNRTAINHWLTTNGRSERLDQHQRALELMVSLLSETPLSESDSREIVSWLREVKPWNVNDWLASGGTSETENQYRRLLFPLWVSIRQTHTVAPDLESQLCTMTLKNVFEKKWSLQQADLLWNTIDEATKQQCRESVISFLNETLTEKSIESAQKVGQQLDTLLQESSRRDYINELEKMMVPVKSYWSEVSDKTDALLTFVRLHLTPLTAGRTEDIVLSGLKNFVKNVSIYAEFPTFLGVMARLRKYRAEASDFWGRTHSLNMEKILVNYFQRVQNHPINFGFHDKNGWQPLNFREILISFHLALKNDLFKHMKADPDQVLALMAQDWGEQEISYIESDFNKMKNREKLSRWYNHIDFCSSHYDFTTNKTPYQYQFESSLDDIPSSIIASDNYSLPGFTNSFSFTGVSEALRLDLAQKWTLVKSMHAIYKKASGQSSAIYLKEKKRRQSLLSDYLKFSRQAAKDFYSCYYSYNDISNSYSFKAISYEEHWLRSLYRFYKNGDQTNLTKALEFGFSVIPDGGLEARDRMKIEGNHLVYDKFSLILRVATYLKNGLPSPFIQSDLPPIDQLQRIKISSDRKRLWRNINDDEFLIDLNQSEAEFVKEALRLFNGRSHNTQLIVTWLLQQKVMPAVSFSEVMANHLKIDPQFYFDEGENIPDDLLITAEEIVDFMSATLSLGDKFNTRYKNENFDVSRVMNLMGRQDIIDLSQYSITDEEGLYIPVKGYFSPYYNTLLDGLIEDSYSKKVLVQIEEEAGTGAPILGDGVMALGYRHWALKQYEDWTSEGVLYIKDSRDIIEILPRTARSMVEFDLNQIRKVICLLKDEQFIDQSLKKFGSRLDTLAITAYTQRLPKHKIYDPNFDGRYLDIVKEIQETVNPLAENPYLDKKWLPRLEHTLNCE